VLSPIAEPWTWLSQELSDLLPSLQNCGLEFALGRKLPFLVWLPVSGSSAGAPKEGYVRVSPSDGSVHDRPSLNLSAAKERDPGLQVVSL
jgi:hypothetical protein